MCGVTEALVATTVISVLASGTATYASVQSQRAATDSQEKIFKYQAEDAAQRGRREEELVRARISRIKSMQRTAFAVSNAVVDFGSSLDVLEDTTYYGELDALNTRANAAREVWNYQTQQGQAAAQSDSLAQQGYFTIGTTLLGSAAAGVNTYGLATGGSARTPNARGGTTTVTGATTVSGTPP